jgi:hypothetical protein
MGAPVTAVLERVPVDRISVEARSVHAGRVLLTVFAALFFAIGWVTAKAWLAVAWCAVAVKVGWQEAREDGSTRRPAG